MNNLETILQKLDSELGTIEAAWKTVLTKSTQSKNISLGEWNMLVDFASRTFSDISVLKTAVEEIINTIGTDDFTANVKTLRPTLVDALNSLTRMQLEMSDTLVNLENNLIKKLDRIEPTDEQIESGQYWVYAIRDRAGKGMIQCESGRKANTIVYRGSDGYFKVYDPIEGWHPASKDYVDLADEELKNYVDLTCEDFVTRVSLVYDSRNYTMALVYNTVLPDGSVSRRLLGPVIDLPLESVVLNAAYDDETKSIVLELVNGSTASIPVGELISGLLPIDLERTNAGYPYSAYTIDANGVPHQTPVSNNPNPRYIPVYNSNRRLKTETPVEDNDCANKKFVDDAVANAGGGSSKLYLHRVQFGGEAWAGNIFGNVMVTVINTDPTSYTKDPGLDGAAGTLANPFTKDDFAFLKNAVSCSGYYCIDSSGDVFYPILYLVRTYDDGVGFEAAQSDNSWPMEETWRYDEIEYLYDTVTEVTEVI